MKILPAILVVLIGLPLKADAEQRIAQTEVDRAFVDACKLNPHYDCTGMMPPVAYKRDWPPFQLGRFEGGNLLFINSMLTRNERHVILVHESTHYLQFSTGAYIFPLSQGAICQTEREAWKASNRVAAWKGYGPQHLVANYTSLANYGCDPGP